MKILIVDDKEENLYLLETLLNGYGYEVESALNGAIALKKLNDDNFDLIISDILMPVMDGFQLCREVKADNLLKKIPFIFYTATYTNAKDEDFAIKLGVDKFIRKPADPVNFIEIIQELLKDLKNDKVKLNKPVLKKEEETFKLYSERLVNKLEKKMLDLEKEITEHKKAEKELKVTNQQLIVSEQQMRATNQQLIASEQQLRAANQQLIANEQQLKISNLQLTKLSTAVKQSPSVIAITDLKGNLEYVNPKFTELTGYSFKEAIGINPRILKSEELPDDRYKELWSTISSGKVWRGEFHNKKKNGELFWESASISPIFDKQGNKINYIKVAEDITDRKKAEEELKKSEHFLFSILESVQDGISVLDPDLTVIHTNGTIKKWYRKNAPLEGKKCYQVYHNSTKPCEPCPTLRCLESGNTEYNIVQGFPGSPVEWLELFSYPIKDPNSDEVTGVVEFVRDITERMLAEEELKKHRNHLEELVKERTKELEAFSYSVSHDLKAPLRAIDGFTRILMKDYVLQLDEEAQRLGTVIQSNSQKMGQLIDDLLSFSRIGRTSMSISEIDMKEIVHAIFSEAISEDQSKRITLNIADLPATFGDTNLMREVWINLVSNALKFSAKRKQAVISVSCKEEENKLIYCIKDNGAGFNMKYKDKLFGVFQRLHSEKEFKGTGVGLALVQRIIHRHDGEIWANSKIGKGATFYFSLPKKVD